MATSKSYSQLKALALYQRKKIAKKLSTRESAASPSTTHVEVRKKAWG